MSKQQTMHTIQPQRHGGLGANYRTPTGRWEVGFVVVSPGSWGNDDNSFWHHSATCETQAEAVELCRKLNGQ